MSSLLSFMNNSHRDHNYSRSNNNNSNISSTNSKRQSLSTMYYKKEMALTDNVALPILSKLKAPSPSSSPSQSSSSSLLPTRLPGPTTTHIIPSSSSQREKVLPNLYSQQSQVSSSRVKSLSSPRSSLSPRNEADSLSLRMSAMALLTSSASSSTASVAVPQSNIPSSSSLSLSHRQLSSSSQSTNGYASSSPSSRISPRSNLSGGLLATISNNILGKSSLLPSSSSSSSMNNKNDVSNKNTSSSSSSSLVCDKCDGKHETDKCPYFKKDRDNHPDAQKNFYQKLGGKSNLPGQMLSRATVIRQPGDGSCLFHSMSYGLSDGSNANKLRAEICNFIVTNPNIKICDTPLSDWIKWDSNCSPADYSRKMSRGSWGGGIEMACASLMKKINVHVYEKHLGNYKRISAFDYPDDPEQRRIVRVIYQGGVHYDALQVN